MVGPTLLLIHFSMVDVLNYNSELSQTRSMEIIKIVVHYI